jgi:hypothetical protein
VDLCRSLAVHNQEVCSLESQFLYMNCELMDAHAEADRKLAF